MNDEICQGVSDIKMLHRYRYHHTDIGADTDADNTSIIYSNFFLNNPTCYGMASPLDIKIVIYNRKQQ